MNALRWLNAKSVSFLDKRLINIEQRMGSVEPWAILSTRLTAADNRKMWNEYRLVQPR